METTIIDGTHTFYPRGQVPIQEAQLIRLNLWCGWIYVIPKWESLPLPQVLEPPQWALSLMSLRGAVNF